MGRENFSPGDTSSFGPLRRAWTDDGFQIRDVSIPYVVRTDMIQIDLQNLFDREADPFSISNQSPRLALNPKPKTEATSLIQNWILEWKTKSLRLLHVGLCSRQMFL